MSLLDSPLLESGDVLRPLETTTTRLIKKARRRQEIFFFVEKLSILNFHLSFLRLFCILNFIFDDGKVFRDKKIKKIEMNFSEFETKTPTKQKQHFDGLSDMLTLTPETDDETNNKQNKENKKETSKLITRPTDQVL